MQRLKFSEVFGGLRERFRTVPDECERACCELKIQGRQVVYRIRLLPGVFRSQLTSAGSELPLSCTRLQTVDISRAGIQEIVGSAFAGCTQLQCVKLSNTLRRIGREAFMKCSSLEVLYTPPALLHINKRAFADCTQLCRLVRIGKKGTWRGIHVEHNIFEKGVANLHSHCGFDLFPSQMQ